jgi:hypothetical protein
MDAHILKFTRAGKFLFQLKPKPQQKPGSNDPVNFWRVAKISIDPGQRGVHRRRHGQSASSCSTWTRACASLLGRVRQQGRRPRPRCHDPATPPAQHGLRNPVHCAEGIARWSLICRPRVNDRIRGVPQGQTARS